ncbi:Calx-beta domain-containing protein [Nocardioides sp. MH1]|uniref:Calx-beta domain-containing protein n=1 Tax=Nocardioides sp. MH1 TaxID=3242490 RepID=UPI0035209F02
MTTLVAALVAAPILAIGATTAPASAGPPASAEFRVNTFTTGDQIGPSVATDPEGNAVVVWSSSGQDGDLGGIYAQKLTATGAPDGAEFRVNLTTVGDQFDPDVAIDASGDFVVSWTSIGQDGSGLGVYARRFFSGSRTPGSEVRINATTAGDQGDSSVAIDATGDFVVTWLSGPDLYTADVYARRYSATGAALGGETLVNITTAGSQYEPEVAMDANGAYVIAWTHASGGANSVYLRRYTRTGAPLTNEFVGDLTNIGSEYEPSVAMDAGGDFVVTWTGYDGDIGEDDPSGVYAQRFTGISSRQGPEVLVNTATSGDQTGSSVAMDADGDYVVTWTSDDADLSGVFTQRYTADGVRVGRETRANLTTTSSQWLAQVGLDADGDALIAWDGSGQDGDGRGIIARRFRGHDSVDLQLHQVDTADPVPVLGTVTYRARVTNLNDASTGTGIAEIDAAIGAATGVYVVSTIPDGATFASASGAGWTCTPGATTVKCRYGGPLAADAESSWLALTYNVPSAAGPLVHQARVYEDQLDAVPVNNGETEATTAMCTVHFTQASVPTNETGSVLLQVDRTGSGCGASSVEWDTVAGSATPGTDFQGKGGELAFSDGDATRQLEIPIYPDALDERLSEDFQVRLHDPLDLMLTHPALATTTIVDDDAPPRINFVTTSGAGAEPGALVDVSVRLSAVSGVPITVSLTRGGTATSGADYFAPTKLTIPAGQRSADLTIEVADDATAEVDETAVLTLAAPSDVVLGSLKTYQLTITSDE